MKLLFLELLLILAVLFSGCSNEPKKKINEPKPKVTQLQKDDVQIVGSANFSAIFSLKETPKSATQNQQAWELKLNLSSNSKIYNDSNYTCKNKYAAITELLKQLMKVPFNSPKSINFKFNGSEFTPVEPIMGTKIDTAALRILITDAKTNNVQTIDLVKEGLYVKPTYELNSKKAKDGKLALEKCLKTVITLTCSQGDFTLDKSIFGECLNLDTSMKVKIDIVPIQKYMQDIAKKIEIPLAEIIKKNPVVDTSSDAEEILFTRVNINAMVNELISIIPRGANKSQNIILSTSSLPRGLKEGFLDFVEVSIKEQKLWLFKNGNLILETDVVTGNKRLGRSTPKGSYKVRSKSRNVTLRGPGYACPVSYWIPFFEGYGLHDANWRDRFGAAIFENRGSHGCVNIPPVNLPIIFANVEIGTPVYISD